MKNEILPNFPHVEKFTNLHTNILRLKPYHITYTGDFNDSNNESTQLDLLFTELGLKQLISQPTHFREHS